MADNAEITEQESVQEAEQAAEEAKSPDQAEQVEAEEKAERTFTQADIDRIIAGRLAKYADYDDMKSRLAQIEEESMSEREREVAKARREAQAEATQAANARIIKSEARALAASMDFENANVAVRLADLSDVTVGEDGEVDADALKSALQTVADEAPGLLKTRKGRLGAQSQASGSANAVESEEALARRILGL